MGYHGANIGNNFLNGLGAGLGFGLATNLLGGSTGNFGLFNFGGGCPVEFSMPNYNASFGFSVPCGGVFSPTIYGMINGDYSFYNPVMPMDMYTYYPGGGAYCAPGGLNFDSNNLFTNLLNVTATQMNHQNFLNSFNNNIPGFNNTPWNNTPGANNSNNSNSTETAEEKAAKKKYDLMYDLLLKYADYLGTEGHETAKKTIEEELDRIKNLKTETEDGKKKNASYEEKYAELETLYNNNLGSDDAFDQFKEFVTGSDRLEIGTGKKLYDALSKAGYECTGSDASSEIGALQSYIDTMEEMNGAKIKILGDLQADKGNILDVISSFNKHDDKNLIEYLASAVGNADEDDARYAGLNAIADILKNSLIKKAKESIKNLEKSKKAEIEKLINRLQDRSDINSYKDDFNKLYACVRIIEAKKLKGLVAEKYNGIIPGEKFEFILDETIQDLEKEGISEKTINKYKGYKLKEGPTIKTNAGEEVTDGAEGADENTEAAKTTKERMDALAEKSKKVKKIISFDGTGVTRYLVSDSKGKYHTYELNDDQLYEKNMTPLGLIGWWNKPEEPDTHENGWSIKAPKVEGKKVSVEDIVNLIDYEESATEDEPEINYAEEKKNAKLIATEVKEKFNGYTNDEDFGIVAALFGSKNKKGTPDTDARVNADNIMFVLDKYGMNKNTVQNGTGYYYSSLLFTDAYNEEDNDGDYDLRVKAVKYMIENLDNLIEYTEDDTQKEILGLYKKAMEAHARGLAKGGHDYRYNYDADVTTTYTVDGKAYKIYTRGLSVTVGELVNYLKEQHLGGF